MNSARYWGDPITSHVDEDSTIRVTHMHEGVIVVIEHPDAVASITIGPGEARLLADSLEKAATQWEA